MVQICDTTLRDGAQGEGITYSLDDKIKVIKLLDELGVSWIEAGNPGANTQDASLFRILQAKLPACRSKITAFGSTCRPGLSAERDEQLRVLSETPAAVKTIFGKSSVFHVENVLRCTRAENLRMIRDSVKYLTDRGNRVWYDAEHFFDAWNENRDYALETVFAAINSGAERVVLCDTNGGSLPDRIRKTTEEVKSLLKVPIGIHCHNDCGLAAANSLCAIESGCDMVQGTIGGVGERCGNVDLCTLIPLISLKLDYRCVPQESLPRLTPLTREILEIINIVPNENAPFVGHSAFAHKGGMHIDAVMKSSSTYEQISPESVGNHRRFLLSDQSGKAGIFARLNKLFPGMERGGSDFETVSERLKGREAKGYTYENADGSFELLALDALGKRPRFFQVVNYHVLCHQPYGSERMENPGAQAYLKIRVHNKESVNAAEGDGPVNALDLALRKTLSTFYPTVKNMRLKDFKVRVLNAKGTASLVRVSIESTDGIHLWNTVGVSENIIEACLTALIDSVDYMLTNYVTKEEISSAIAEE